MADSVERQVRRNKLLVLLLFLIKSLDSIVFQFVLLVSIIVVVLDLLLLLLVVVEAVVDAIEGALTSRS